MKILGPWKIHSHETHEQTHRRANGNFWIGLVISLATLSFWISLAVSIYLTGYTLCTLWS